MAILTTQITTHAFKGNSQIFTHTLKGLLTTLTTHFCLGLRGHTCPQTKKENNFSWFPIVKLVKKHNTFVLLSHPAPDILQFMCFLGWLTVRVHLACQGGEDLQTKNSHFRLFMHLLCKTNISFVFYSSGQVMVSYVFLNCEQPKS